ncbi:tRNA pseudouridine(55) synthase TruB [Wolbachia pipientis]|uniref:tRNA pseudouridine synthase B n=1 Tax=Wolbachia pipientis TaxID=955 RepID=A0A1E7QJZ7_WOLPI|nr:tRNA pseudouridine(55) synthase TruB [Wolbachia pipientis]OEY86788.1 tRNA pseudouridine(55) synthase TruB [Wolbachia pipientis]
MCHGWINIDKPVGISSAQAVNQVKKIFNIKKAGHIGTLDPVASGVLPIALGEATKTIPYLSCNLKAYNFTVQWGEQRSTDDVCGEIIKISAVKPEYNQINYLTKNFIGEIVQTPPLFSAIKINGIRSYKLARSGQNVDIKPRLVRIHDLKVLFIDAVNNSAEFFMLCGSGVYVRSVARDMGIALNCFGYVTKLRRVMVGNFKENGSVQITQLTANCEISSITSILYEMSGIEISEEDAKKIGNGKKIRLNNLYNLKNYDICYVTIGELPVAICSFICGYIQPMRVFNF